ncbi:peptidase [Kitasatospora cineracea]|uniref:peptidase n=1 Tax=Kitasatospora cineracea TaxID=88074 RepID=UPI00380A3E03
MSLRARAAALLATAVLASALLPAATASAAPPVTLRPDAAAAGWLAGQLVDGDHLESSFGGVSYPDQGLTVDAVLAFAAAEVSDDAAARATAWLARPANLAGYAGDGAGESYAGATAKLAFAAEVRGADPAAFGGVDLVARLRALQQPSGRFSDLSQWGDYSNSLGQSYALLALARTPGGAPAAAVGFLAGAQCADGGFPVAFGQPVCTADPDATALAAQALAATGRGAAARAGLSWLVAHQGADGSLAAAGAAAGNANSTGLAAQALLTGGRPVAGVRAWGFVHSLQAGCGAPAADRGAVAYDATGLDPATAPRATAQAVLGLSGAPLAGLSAHGARAAAPVLACTH